MHRRLADSATQDPVASVALRGTAMVAIMGCKPVEHHPAFEEYSETVHELTEDGVEVIQARIAERLDVSHPAVSEMIRRMQREGLVKVDDDAHRGRRQSAPKRP